jgi:hypothetical protein
MFRRESMPVPIVEADDRFSGFIANVFSVWHLNVLLKRLLKDNPI